MVGGMRQLTGRFVSGTLSDENQLQNDFHLGNPSQQFHDQDPLLKPSLFSDLPENVTESAHWREVDHAVRMALALEAGEAEMFLKALADRKPELYEEVIWFLDAQDRLDGFMEVPVAEKLSDYLNEPTRVSSIKSSTAEYRILDHLGEGGMGQVYLVERQGCLGRKVALKILKEEGELKNYRARFENEIRLLAHLNHPHISHVYDVGETIDKRPFFTMEYVPGLPLNQFCKHHQLDLEARLDLFLQICSGIAYAHSRGVIHRDLKPANILVTLRDDQPVAKIIDFGIAKSTSAGTITPLVHTRMDQILGTPFYMSPEQIATISGTDIDPRSDVFVLGALLYEMVTGFPARDPNHLENLPVMDALRQIAEAKFTNPSAVISQAGSDHVSKEYGSHVVPGGLVKHLRGDFDSIVEKAMTKNRMNRYDSVKTLMGDIRAYLDGEPVTCLASKPLYRFRKCICRKRLDMITVLFAILSIIIFIVWGLDRSRSDNQNYNQLNIKKLNLISPNYSLPQAELESEKTASDRAAVLPAIRKTSSLKLLQLP